MQQKTTNTVTVGLLLALCIVGANIKILGSIALDAFPAFLGALLVGPKAGAFLGLAGHLVSAALAGFPYSLPIHLIVGFMMMISCYCYGKTFFACSSEKAGHFFSILVGYFLSVVVDLMVCYPFLGNTVYVIYVPLSIAALVNLGLSAAVYSIVVHRDILSVRQEKKG